MNCCNRCNPYYFKMENQTFELLAEYQYPSEAFIYKGKVESEGIEIFMRDLFTIDANPMMSNAVGGVKLYVKSEDYDKAKAILSDVSRFSLDNDGKLMNCPNCGVAEIEMQTTIRNKKGLVPFLVSLLMGGLPYHVSYVYRCAFEFTKTAS